MFHVKLQGRKAAGALQKSYLPSGVTAEVDAGTRSQYESGACRTPVKTWPPRAAVGVNAYMDLQVHGTAFRQYRLHPECSLCGQEGICFA